MKHCKGLDHALMLAALFVLPFDCVSGNETNGVSVCVPVQKVAVIGKASLNEARNNEAGKSRFELYKGECEEVGIALGEAADEADKLFYLAVAYEYGERGLRQDYAKAMRLYREAAAAGSAVAMGNLGLMYKYGKGVSSNDVRAVYWFKKAADAGDSLGMHNWALAEAFGKGAERNLFGAKSLLLLNDKYEPSARWLRTLIKDQDITSGLALAVQEHDDRNAALWCAERYENEDSAEFDLFNAARYYGAYFYGKEFIVSSRSFLDRDENGPSNSRLGELLKGNPITNASVIVELARAYANPKFRMQDLSVSDMLYFNLLNKMDLHDESLNKELEKEYSALKNEMVEVVYVRDRAFNGDIDAMVELGRRYVEGRGVSYNYAESIACFKTAREKQQQAAQLQRRGIGAFVKNNGWTILGGI